MPVVGLTKKNGLVRGVVARDAETGREFDLTARVVVNATGVFADDVRRLDDPSSPPMLAPSQGVHIVLDQTFLPGESAIMVPRTDDGRVLFVIPWHGRALIGTTDTPVPEPQLEPKPLAAEIDFLLTHAARYLTKDPSPADVLSTFAGLRPLVHAGDGQSTAATPRDHAVVVSASGLVTITGGKWTTYRKMGEDTVDEVALVGGLDERPCVTKELRLHGWIERALASSDPFTANPHLLAHGADTPALDHLAQSAPGLEERLHSALPYRAAEVVWAARHEMARTVEDVLSRRTRALLLDARASMAIAPRVASLLARELGRDPAWEQHQVAEYLALAQSYVLRPNG
jgi:glycerol-3-phosphate dehydrogenase